MTRGQNYNAFLKFSRSSVQVPNLSQYFTVRNHKYLFTEKYTCVKLSVIDTIKLKILISVYFRP